MVILAEGRAGLRSAVVVGTGLAGLATTIGPRKAGWHVRALNTYARLERYGAAFAIPPPPGRHWTGWRRRGIPRAGGAYRQPRIHTPDATVMGSLPLERTRW